MELSNVIQQYQQVVRDASAALTQRSEKNAAQLVSLLSQHLLSGETAPEFRLLFVLLSRHVQYYQKHIEDADQRHAQELGDDIVVLQAREDTAAKVYRELVQIRSELEAAFGSAGVAALGMTGITPRQPDLLERYAADILDRLQKGVSLGTPTRRRVSFDAKAVAEDLAPLCEALTKASAAVTREVAEAKDTQDAKNQAISEWDSNVPLVIAAAKALFALAGDSEGAARLYSTPASYRRASSTPPDLQSPE